MHKLLSIVCIVLVAFTVSTLLAEERDFCSSVLTRQVVEKSLELGTAFMLNNQRPAGNFAYEYKWISKTDSADDNAVRQAGALWGLSLIFQATKGPAVEAAFYKALDFFDQRSKVRADGARFIVYGTGQQSLGTVALVTLALIDYLRAKGESAFEKRQALEKQLGEYLKFLTGSRRPDKLWHQYYDPNSGASFGPSSPYADGESLLALVKAARYLRREDLKPVIMESAAAGLAINIKRALEIHPDSAVTKGFYQWSSMAFYELSQTGWPDTAVYGDEVIKLAIWMIDVHRTLERGRNTAYAYEGIIHAYALAKQKNDRVNTLKFGCVIERGLEKLTSWQVGGPIPNPFIRSKQSSSDIRAIGGIQNHASEEGLRIDVTQHQMHALILALQHYFPVGPKTQ